MSLVLTSIVAGTVGGAVSAAVIHYSESYYEEKIAELEEHARTLSRHLETLENYSNEIKDFWPDDTGLEYAKKIYEKIMAVKTAMEKVQHTKEMYQGIMSEQKRTKQLVQKSTAAIGSIKTGLEDK